MKKAKTCSLFTERKNSFTKNELSVLNREFTCRELLSTTKIIHKISSHNCTFQFHYHFFILLLLGFVRLSLFIYKKYADVIKYNYHILECSLSFDWLKIFYSLCLRHILQYSAIFKGLVSSSKLALVNSSHSCNSFTISPGISKTGKPVFSGFAMGETAWSSGMQ